MGIIFFICLSLGYVFLFAFPRKQLRMPLTPITSLDLSLSSSDPYSRPGGVAGLRKQYDFLTKNGLLASGLNLHSTMTDKELPAVSLASPPQIKQSLLLSAISSLLKEFIKELLLSKGKLRALLSSLLKAMASRKQAATPGANDDDALIKEFLIDPFVKESMNLYKALKNSQLYELVWLNGLTIFEEQIQLYKGMRQDYVLTKPSESRHLDEFNEFSAESTDESLNWVQNVEKMNQQILVRLEMSGKLHPSVLKNDETSELDHLRGLFTNFMTFLKSKYPGYLFSNSKIINVLLREVIVCQCVFPLVKKIASPYNLNTYILEKVMCPILQVDARN